MPFRCDPVSLRNRAGIIALGVIVLCVAVLYVWMDLGSQPKKEGWSGEFGRAFTASISHANEQDYAEAESSARWALELGHRDFGPEDARIITLSANLAFILRMRGHYDEAERLFLDALASAEATYFPRDLRIARLFEGLANLYVDQERYEEAARYQRRAVKILEVSGKDYPDKAQALRLFGILHSKLGRYEDAESSLKRSLALYEGALDPNDPEVSSAAYFLAELYAIQGRYGEAEPLYRRALEIDRKILGPGRQDLVYTLEAYAALLRATGRENEARKLEARAEKVRAEAA